MKIVHTSFAAINTSSNDAKQSSQRIGSLYKKPK